MADTRVPKQPEVGPIGRNLIAAVDELRQARGGMSWRKLSGLLERIGRPIFPLGLARLSRAERRVDVDELVALAVAFGVNPSALLFPRHVAPDDVVELAPQVQQRAALVWAWADGKMPLPDKLALPGTDVAETPGDRYADFVLHARPDGVQADPDPAVKAAYDLATRIDVALRDFANPDSWDYRREYLERGYKLLGIMLDELIARGDREAAETSRLPGDRVADPFGQRAGR